MLRPAARRAPGTARRSAAAARGRGAALPPCAHAPAPYTGPTLDEVLAKRRKHVHPVHGMYYGEDPLMLVEGRMQYVWDSSGARLLDMWGGVTTVSVGHSHPRIARVVSDQAGRIQHPSLLYLNPHMGEYAEALTATLPAGHEWVVYFTNSGTEANEVALQMARLHSGRYTYVSLHNCYHGMAGDGVRSMTATKGWQWPYQKAAGHAYTACPNPYRGVMGDDTGKYLAALQGVLEETTGGVAGFIAEPIQGIGGTMVLPEGYLAGAYDLVRKAGGVCVADEVQTGFGRLGGSSMREFWGFQHAGAAPDVVVMAKSIGNGFPLGAVCAKREVAQSMTGKAHFNTYGGNPTAMRVGLEVLRIIEEEGLQRRCGELGDRLVAGLRRLQAKHPLIGDVRGKGLMLGVELVTDRATKEPAAAELARVMQHMRRAGVLVGRGGGAGNVMRLKPPMCISDADCDFTVDALDAALSAA